MFKGLILFSNLILALIMNVIFGEGVKVTQNSPNQVDPGGEFVVELIINKTDVSGFAKIVQELPEGFLAESIETQGASFTYNDNKVKLIWMALPEADEFSVKYKVTVGPDVEGVKLVSGKFSYLYNNERKTVDLPVNQITVGEEEEVIAETTEVVEETVEAIEETSVVVEEVVEETPVEVEEVVEETPVVVEETVEVIEETPVVVEEVVEENPVEVEEVVEETPVVVEETVEVIEETPVVVEEVVEETPVEVEEVVEETPVVVEETVEVIEETPVVVEEVVEETVEAIEETPVVIEEVVEETAVVVEETPVVVAEVVEESAEVIEETPVVERASETLPEINGERKVTDMGNGTFKIEISIRQNGIDGFAKEQEQLPAGVTMAKSIETKNAVFSFVDNQAKFVWMSVPEDDPINISYTVSGNNLTAESLRNMDGTFAYLFNEETKKSKITPSANQPDPIEPIVETTPDPVVETTPDPVVETTPEPVVDAITEPTASIPAPENGVTYKVQICAGHDQVDINPYFKLTFSFTEGPIMIENHEGWVKYTIGGFGEYKTARDRRNVVTAGYELPGPFVSAYNDGIRITVQEALMISNQKWIL